MVLDVRLGAAAALVPRGARLADIGSDHTYLPIALCLEGKIESALASDINAQTEFFAAKYSKYGKSSFSSISRVASCTINRSPCFSTPEYNAIR